MPSCRIRSISEGETTLYIFYINMIRFDTKIAFFVVLGDFGKYRTAAKGKKV